MNSEIGSEFWATDLCGTVHPVAERDHLFLLSGRTALDCIIREVKLTRDMKSVYMPSYCCHTMIQPFTDNDISVEFYEVGFKNGKYTYDLDVDKSCDAVLMMQYFGFYDSSVVKIIRDLKNRGKTIIEDATHSWFSALKYHDNSDYVFVSFRKWTGLPAGAVAIKRDGKFVINTPAETNSRYISIREKAKALKREYILEGKGEKEGFLGLFRQAEELLEQDYRGYSLTTALENSIVTLDYEKIQRTRKSNAAVLINGIKDNKNIVIPEIKETDVPLFVPILVAGGRNRLRQHLIEQNIYCPVHWPLSVLHHISNRFLYDNSLSLVCDQRYAAEDMIRCGKAVNDFFREM